MKLLSVGCVGVTAEGYACYEYCMTLKMADEDKEQIKEPSLTEDTRTTKQINTQYPDLSNSEAITHFFMNI